MVTTPSLRRALAGLAMLCGLAWASPVAGQGGCQFGAGTGDFRALDIPGAGRVTYVGKPHFVCADGVHIWADSAVAYSAQNMSHLLGRVRYVDRTRELRADEARYFTQAARIQASGNVFLRDTVQGSEIENGDLVYLRRADFRTEEQITVTTGFDGVRPRARLFMKVNPDTTGIAQDSAAMPPDSTAPAPDSIVTAADTARTPYVVEGDRIFLQGDAYFLATGNVVIDRDSLLAFGDTAEYDQVAERMLLRGSARVDGSTYDLVGRSINIALPSGEMGSVRALREAVLTGEDIRLEAPLIQLFLADGRMERLVATPLPGDPMAPPRTAADSADLARPVAAAEGFRLVADSVEVLAPGEVLEQIFAVGRARGESSSRDSLNVPSLPEIALTDWLEGDTVIATFAKVEPDPFLPPDTLADEYRLEELRAVGSARSLYRMLPTDTVTRPGIDPPAVHYVTGASIIIAMLDGEVDRMEVEGPTRGWHLEPERKSEGRDSLLAPDSALVPPDTGAVGRDTSGLAVPAGSQRPPPDSGREGKSDQALPAAVARERGRGRRSRR